VHDYRLDMGYVAPGQGTKTEYNFAIFDGAQKLSTGSYPSFAGALNGVLESLHKYALPKVMVATQDFTPDDKACLEKVLLLCDLRR
jgi:hypothetical protein